MFKIKCDACKIENIIDVSSPSGFSINHHVCHACGNVLKFKTESIFINKPLENIKEDSDAYENGTIVTITNEDHPWNDDLAIIRGKKHKHHKVELHGVTLWVPNHWIKLNEPINDDR